MNASISHVALLDSHRKAPRPRTRSRLALLAASASFAALASSAYAQCVEGPPSTFSCSGQTDVAQILAADDATVTTNPSFSVDTSNNGNGLALEVIGNGLISFEGSPDLTGAGVHFRTTGASGQSVGEIVVLSNGDIFANGANGLRLDNGGGGDTSALWVGSIENIGGNGVLSRSEPGAGELSLIVDDVAARDDGIRVSYDGSGSATVTALGPVLGHTGAGVQINSGVDADDIDLTVGDVTGGTNGIAIVNQGSDITKVDASGVVTGLSGAGIRVSAGANTLGIDIRAAQVNGETSGVLVNNTGLGNTTIVATGPVTGTSQGGIIALNGDTAGAISITATDVSGDLGIRAFNDGVGSITIVSTGDVVGTGTVGISAVTDVTATGILVDAHNVVGDQDGITVTSNGTGATTVRASGAVTGTNDAGVRVAVNANAGAVDVAVNEVTGGTWGVIVDNNGVGAAKVTASGTVTGLENSGIGVDGGATTSGIEVLAGAVNGQSTGIQTANFGSGDTTIVATGPVAGASDVGVRAYSGFDASDISISVDDVVGTFGVTAINEGAGSTSVVSTGDVLGAFVDGIRLETEATTTDALVTAHNVAGFQLGIQVNNLGTGVTTVRADGAVSGEIGSGIKIQTGTASQDVIVDAANVTGTSGIDVTNFGLGSTNISATGAVVGQAADGTGILVTNGTGSIDLLLSAINVQGGQRGIDTNNEGVGDTFIATTGLVSGGEFGIYAKNGLGTGDLTVRASEVQSDGTGVAVENFGSGKTTVIVGTATGGALSAVRAFAGENAGDLSVEVGTVSGGYHGVLIRNQGTGAASVTATGLVTGGTHGIRARNDAGPAGDLTIRATDVHSGGWGVTAENAALGDVMVFTTGTVTADEEVGIFAATGETARDIVVEAATVSGGLSGIRTDGSGVGATSITATGLVSGADFGIAALNRETTTDLAIRAIDVQSNGNAILAEALGSGETSVITTGTVASRDKEGIRVSAAATAGDILVEANDVSGGLSGVSTMNYGLGDTRITVNGVAQGATRGVEAFSDGNQGVLIVNNGTIRNASGLSSDRAISASGGTVGVGNVGTLVGTVEIAGDMSLLLNAGNWLGAGGVSTFATVDDALFNVATGTIVGGVQAATAESTVWQGLERFQNDGVLRLQDGGVGDVVLTSAATVFTGGSTLAVDIGGASGADGFHTTGTLAIEPGSRLQVVTGQPLALHGKYVVVQADGGLTGKFVFDDQLVTAFAGLRDGYTATSAYLEFAQMKALASAGITPNQKAAAAGADSLPDGNAVKDALLMLPTDTAAQAAFDQLSGEIHPSARNAMAEDSRLIRSAVLDRLADGQPESSVWGRLFGASGVSNGDENVATLDRDASGGVIGLDRNIGSATVGVAGGWSDTKLRVAGRDSRGSIEGAHAMVYAGGRFGQFGLRGAVGYARTSTETTRHIAFAGFSGSPSADYDGSVLQGVVEAGYRTPVKGGHVEPFASVAAIRAKTDAFAETGGPAALSGAAESKTTVSTMLGARFETQLQSDAFSMRGTVGWRHGWGDLDPVGRHAFAGGAPFTVLGTAGSRDAGVFNAEVRYRLSPNVTLGVGYDGVLGAGGADHAITGAFKIVF